MSRIVAIDTSTEACSVALRCGEKVYSRYELAPRKHTSLVIPMLDAVMAEANCDVSELDAVAFGAGPGSFTGLRIACGVAQGIAFAMDIPVIPVSTLASLALQGFNANPQLDIALVALDARMDEVYWGVYQRQAESVAALQDDRVCKIQDLILPDGVHVGLGVGSGYSVHGPELEMHLADSLISVSDIRLPDAAVMVQIACNELLNGRTVSANEALPVYLRDQVVQNRPAQA